MPDKSNLLFFKKKPDTSSKKTVLVIVCLVIGIIFVSLFTPIFSVKDIIVVGNTSMESDVLIKASGISKGDGFFEVNPFEIKENIAKIAYVDTVKVKRVFPDKIKIIITESSETAYISFVGNYVGIDNNGKILEIKQQLDETSKPVIEGVHINDFTIGSYIDIEDKHKEEVLFELLGEINANNVSDSIYCIDITDTNNIYLILKNSITVKFGNFENLRYKTAYLKTVLGELKDATGGTLDISDTENVVYQG